MEKRFIIQKRKLTCMGNDAEPFVDHVKYAVEKWLKSVPSQNFSLNVEVEQSDKKLTISCTKMD